MAVWQFDLFLVPEAAIARIAGEGAQRVEKALFERSRWWLGGELPSDYRTAFDALLPRGGAWGVDVEAWGAEQSSRIVVVGAGARPEEVFVRLDARTVDLELIEGLAQFASRAGCAFITEEMEVVRADAAAVLKELKDSAASRFVLDPGAYLSPPDPEIGV